MKLYSGSANGTEAATFTGPAMLDAASTNDYDVHAVFNRHSSYVNHLLGRGRGQYGQCEGSYILAPPTRTQPPPRVGESAMLEKPEPQVQPVVSVQSLELSF